MNKKLTAAGGLMMITGIGMTIAGLNISGDTGRWISVIGNILFFIGLIPAGAAFFLARRKKEQMKPDPEKTEI